MITFFVPKYIQNKGNNIEEIKEFLLKYKFNYHIFHEIDNILYFASIEISYFLKINEYLLVYPTIENNRLSENYEHLILTEEEFVDLIGVEQ